ncbi:unnamed protein product [Menidia menidia]|uniref:(Atlantic silverside) hypothetical protein n=1 Tax=Menidia menidia TaxID=238744 RepID=A0A8S4B0G9_9TELE|nr:unnamed protein product [Menidia menidia]
MSTVSSLWQPYFSELPQALFRLADIVKVKKLDGGGNCGFREAIVDILLVENGFQYYLLDTDRGHMSRVYDVVILSLWERGETRSVMIHRTQRTPGPALHHHNSLTQPRASLFLVSLSTEFPIEASQNKSYVTEEDEGRGQPWPILIGLSSPEERQIRETTVPVQALLTAMFAQRPIIHQQKVGMKTVKTGPLAQGVPQRLVPLRSKGHRAFPRSLEELLTLPFTHNQRPPNNACNDGRLTSPIGAMLFAIIRGSGFINIQGSLVNNLKAQQRHIDVAEKIHGCVGIQALDQFVYLSIGLICHILINVNSEAITKIGLLQDVQEIVLRLKAAVHEHSSAFSGILARHLLVQNDLDSLNGHLSGLPDDLLSLSLHRVQLQQLFGQQFFQTPQDWDYHSEAGAQPDLQMVLEHELGQREGAQLVKLWDLLYQCCCTFGEGVEPQFQSLAMLEDGVDGHDFHRGFEGPAGLAATAAVTGHMG